MFLMVIFLYVLIVNVLINVAPKTHTFTNAVRIIKFTCRLYESLCKLVEK